MKRKILMILSLCVLCSMILGACGPQQSEQMADTTQAPAETTVVTEPAFTLESIRTAQLSDVPGRICELYMHLMNRYLALGEEFITILPAICFTTGLWTR